MFHIKTMNKIAAVGLEHLPADTYAVGDETANEDGAPRRALWCSTPPAPTPTP